MALPQARITLITVAVCDVARASRFYEALGFTRKVRKTENEVAFLEAGNVVLACWGASELAKDAKFGSDSLPAFRGIALAWNCESEEAVDAIIAAAKEAGGAMQKPAVKTSWGGYAGYFTDPDGHLWEVAHNPHFPLSADGRLQLPD